MFKLLLIALMVTCFLLPKSSFGQVSDTEKQRQIYLSKWKSQKTTGWILLGGGVGCLIIAGILMDPYDEDDPYGILTEEKVSGGATALAFIGGAATIASIPVFISAGKNRRRAAELSFGPGSIRIPQLVSRKVYQAGMKLTIPL